MLKLYIKGGSSYTTCINIKSYKIKNINHLLKCKIYQKWYFFSRFAHFVPDLYSHFVILKCCLSLSLYLGQYSVSKHLFLNMGYFAII